MQPRINSCIDSSWEGGYDPHTNQETDLNYQRQSRAFAVRLALVPQQGPVSAPTRTSATVPQTRQIGLLCDTPGWSWCAGSARRARRSRLIRWAHRGRAR
jgi:hypothetical protein